MNIHWSDQLERILKKEGEKCESYGWLHRESEKKYSKYNNWLTVPSIILGIVNGAISVGSNQIFGDFSGASVVIGFVGVFTSILASINNFFKNNTRAENHRMASLIYDSLHQDILIELSLARKDRTKPELLLKMIKEDLKKIKEIVPLIPDDVILKYKEKFKDEIGISKPNICNGLTNIEINTIESLDTPITVEVVKDNKIKVGLEI